MPFADLKQRRKYAREWIYRKRRDPKQGPILKSYQQQYNQKWKAAQRVKALMILGGKCRICNCNNLLALEINHIHGGGQRERKRRDGNHTKLYAEIINGKRKDVEVLCRPCNAAHFLKRIKKVQGDWKIVWIPQIPIIDRNR
jgi:hypothetical protein